MAKVMVSLPDDLLGVLDVEAARRNTTRSGLLRDYVHEGLRHRGQERARRVEQLMSEAAHHGGDGVGDLKRHRPTA
ncbi:MAG: CopG family transcriptional regulator [Frankiaceae bacterium]